MIDILYEDNHLIAINKRSSDLVQGDRSGDESLDNEVKKYLARKYNKPGDAYLGVVHRLDRPVSGVLLFARTSKALTRLNDIFRTRQVRKIYWAIVKERPPGEEETVEHFMKKNEAKNKSFTYDHEIKGSKKASLTYKLIGRSVSYYLLEIELHTGRHHQIRAQMAALGCPVMGDLKYGFPRSNEDGSISLHSKRLEFIHPVTKEGIVITAPVPEGKIWQAFEIFQ